MRTVFTLLVLGFFLATTSAKVSAEFINVIAATASNTESGSALATVNGSGFTPGPLGSDLGSHIANIGTHWLGDFDLPYPNKSAAYPNTYPNTPNLELFKNAGNRDNSKVKGTFRRIAKCLEVEDNGLEPMTSCMPCKRSPN